jgi:hypothetical protein
MYDFRSRTHALSSSVDRGGNGMAGRPGGAERERLALTREGTADWKRWGPYVSERQWGTVREDYSPDGTAWEFFPHDHARSRSYRWGEDGLAGICDRWQHFCLGLALWNGRDPILKERLFGLTNNEGNHGEDVKEYWWHLDSTPTHSWMQWLYKYPQAEFPYARLVDENRSRGIEDHEFDLADTGIFDENRYFDVLVTYAKATPNDICIQIECTNHGPDAAPLHLLPTAWFRNTWAWGRDPRHPELWAYMPDSVQISHGTLGQFWLTAQGDPAQSFSWLFTENESNAERLWGATRRTPYVKDGIADHVMHGTPTVNPENAGTKAAAWYQLQIEPGATATVRLRLADREPRDNVFGAAFDRVIAERRAEADDFFAGMVAPDVPDEGRHVARRAIAGLLWCKQYYHYDVEEWLAGDPAGMPVPPNRADGRNSAWRHLHNTDIISMPDSWEYPWYAAWDLAFHCIPLAFVDPDFAKDQLILLCREWFMHPNGQLPAYEWSFSDVNPPVHAWAAWRVFKIDWKNSGTPDWLFLERVFQKLLLNFTWWVNRKDTEGNNVFEGGFLGLDNISLFDRSQRLADGAHLEQSDATSWMAMFCLNMLGIALELAAHDPAYEDVATKFFEHFLYIAHAMNNLGRHHLPLWDEEDGFYYDLLHADGHQEYMRVRSLVGLLPVLAVTTIDPEVMAALPDFTSRMNWLMKEKSDLTDNIHSLGDAGRSDRRLLSILNPERLRRILERLFDEDEFLSPHGIRSVSRWHLEHPVRLDFRGMTHELRYTPGESATWLFGGNSNWRGPVWFPINYLIVESLQRFHHYFGEDFLIEVPTGSGNKMSLWDASVELSRRLVSLFMPDGSGRRPSNGGRDLFDFDPNWRQHVTFSEYFHGDNGSGLGASHQTGWTALVAKLIRQSGI